MAVVLLQLKLAIQRRALGHGGGGQRALYAAGWLLALVLGLGAGAVVQVLASAGDGLGDLGLVAVLTVVFLGWLLSPLILPGMADETVDPARLEQFPIPARQQVAGLLLGSLVAPTALFTFLTAAGGTLASGESATARVLVAVAAVVFTVLCVAVSRSVQALLSGVLQTRRARDLMIAFSGAIGLALYLVSRSAHNLTELLVDLENDTVETTLSWLPSGAMGGGMIAIRDGQWGLAAGHTLVALVTLGVAVAVWEWGIRRRVRGTSGGHGRARQSRQPAAELELLPLPLAALAARPSTGAAAQTLRYWFFRQPRATQSVVMLPVMGVVVAHSMIEDGGLVPAAAIFAFMVSFVTFFQMLAYEDEGFTFLLGTGAPMGDVLRGKALAGLIVLIPPLLGLVVVEALINDLWSDAAGALLAGLNIALVGIGVGASVSVWAPVNAARPGGQRGRALLGTFGGMALMLALSIPAIAVWVAFSDVDPLVTTLATLPLCAGIGWLLLRRAGRVLSANPWRAAEALGV